MALMTDVAVRCTRPQCTKG